MWQRLRSYAVLMRLHRPIGILLLLWPTLWALWIAGGGAPDAVIVAIFIAGVVLMRSAGCVINDYADRDFDAHVARTRERPLAQGRVTPREALALFTVLALIAFCLVLQLNRTTVALSFAALALAVAYPFMKRFTHWPQAFLGVAFGWGIPMAFAAQTGAVPAVAWNVFAANVAWTIAYDTAYAMADRADDVKIGVKSTAILFGRYDRVAIALLHAAALVLLLAAGAHAGLGTLYYVGLAGAAGNAAYQQYLLRSRTPADCMQAFLSNNWFGASVFVGAALNYVGHSLGTST